MSHPSYIAKTIIKAINFQFSAHVVLNANEFFGKEGKVVRMYVVKDAYYDGHTWVDEELFRTTSANYALLFCRDLLYSLQGKPIPPAENEGYQNCREKHRTDERIQYMVNVYGNRGDKESAEPT